MPLLLKRRNRVTSKAVVVTSVTARDTHSAVSACCEIITDDESHHQSVNGRGIGKETSKYTYIDSSEKIGSYVC